MAECAVLWLRQDLRLADHAALRAALAGARTVVPVYVWAPQDEGDWPPGAASRWWLHHSLSALAQALGKAGSRLVVRTGTAAAALAALARECGADTVHAHARAEPAARAQERTVHAALAAQGARLELHAGALLADPEHLRTGGGAPYRVFAPFQRAVMGTDPVRALLARPRKLPPVPDAVTGVDIAALGLLPDRPWDAGLAARFNPGEAGAQARLAALDDGLALAYARERDTPAHDATSLLSAHLHFGEISPAQLLAALAERSGAGPVALVRELVWREFCQHLLWHCPDLPDAPLDLRYAGFAWRTDGAELRAWQRGRTGFPFVDAGMAQLWHTGHMHARARMVAATVLTKHLMADWRAGARWFWDTLVDADLANNTVNWQWVAGTGADAAPYFRVMNPVLQGQRFDPDGAYVRAWVPALARLPARWIHAPWQAPGSTLRAAGIALERDDPLPVVDLAAGRARFLDAAKNHLARASAA